MSRVESVLLKRSERLMSVDVEPGVCVIGTWQNLVVSVWWSAGTGPAVERLEQVILTMRERYPYVSHIHLVKNRAGMPTEAARAALIRLMTKYANSIANCAVVIGGTGFWASTMRSAITGMRFISPRAFEMRLHGEVSEILEWLPEAHKRRTKVDIKPVEMANVLSDADEWLRGDFESMQAFS